MNEIKLKERMAALPKLQYFKKDGSAGWPERRVELRNKVITEDITGFISWPLIQSVMWVGAQKPLTGDEWVFIRNHWPDTWRDILYTPDICGDKYDTTHHGINANSIHTAYHLALFEDTIGKNVSDVNSIMEFGGGFGNMARIVRQAGFKGDYYLYDFPEFLLLQEYYLDRAGALNYPTIFCHDDRSVPQGSSLMIATNSLSEAPVIVRDWFCQNFYWEHLLIHAAFTWDGVDNLHYFSTTFEFVEMLISPSPNSFYALR